MNYVISVVEDEDSVGIRHFVVLSYFRTYKRFDKALGFLKRQLKCRDVTMPKDIISVVPESSGTNCAIFSADVQWTHYKPFLEKFLRYHHRLY